jgi:hypothetical protein
MTTAKLRNSTGNSVKISGGKSVTRYTIAGSREPADIVHWCRIRYHGIVSNAKKTLAGMRRNARNWRMEDLEVVAHRFGFQA